MRFFNTAGPVNRHLHYCLPPLERLDLEEILLLIQQQKYFVLHAPRQTGKTSVLLALMDFLNAQEIYRCVYMNAEIGQAAREDVAAAMAALLDELGSWAMTALNDPFIQDNKLAILAHHSPYTVLGEALRRWSLNTPKPLVVLIDEIDSLVGDTLISVLRQLRAGYTRRPREFPQSVVLRCAGCARLSAPFRQRKNCHHRR